MAEAPPRTRVEGNKQDTPSGYDYVTDRYIHTVYLGTNGGTYYYRKKRYVALDDPHVQRNEEVPLPTARPLPRLSYRATGLILLTAGARWSLLFPEQWGETLPVPGGTRKAGWL
jgi:hypothetical protein